MKEREGLIHSFQSMGAVDGPGLRYVVFMQGCSLRCCYCHNPDTWNMDAGQRYTTHQVLERILRYKTYLKRGGVTVTGGEPLLQPEFTEELFRLLKEQGIHTALDTSGIGDPAAAERVLGYTDLALVDVKFLSEEEYRRHTGASFKRVLDFLDLCRKTETSIWVRHVVVPGLTDGEAHVQRLWELLKAYPNLQKIELLPFRKLCLEKYDALSIPFPLRDTPQTTLKKIEELKLLLPEHLL